MKRKFMTQAAFVCYWEMPDEKPEPMFRVLANSDMLAVGSTVGGVTLMQYGVALPLFPDFKTWRRMVDLKRRCGRCWQAMRGAADLNHHYSNTTCGAWAAQRLAS